MEMKSGCKSRKHVPSDTQTGDDTSIWVVLTIHCFLVGCSYYDHSCSHLSNQRQLAEMLALIIYFIYSCQYENLPQDYVQWYVHIPAIDSAPFCFSFVEKNWSISSCIIMSNGEEIHTHLLVSKQKAYTIVADIFLQKKKHIFLNTSFFKLIYISVANHFCMCVVLTIVTRQHFAMGARK